MFKLVTSVMKDGKDVEKYRGKVWKEHMGRITNEENKCDQNAEADLVEGPVEIRKEVVKAMGEMKVGKAGGSSEVSSGEIGIYLMVELCQGVLHGRGMPDIWELSVAVPIFKGKGDAMSCGAYTRGVNLLKHA